VGVVRREVDFGWWRNKSDVMLQKIVARVLGEEGGKGGIGGILGRWNAQRETSSVDVCKSRARRPEFD